MTPTNLRPKWHASLSLSRRNGIQPILHSFSRHSRTLFSQTFRSCKWNFLRGNRRRRYDRSSISPDSHWAVRMERLHDCYVHGACKYMRLRYCFPTHLPPQKNSGYFIFKELLMMKNKKSNSGNLLDSNDIATSDTTLAGDGHEGVQTDLKHGNYTKISESAKTDSVLNSASTDNIRQPNASVCGDSRHKQDVEETEPNAFDYISKPLLWLLKITGFHIFGKSYRFVILCLTQMLVGLSFSGVMVHLVNHIGIVCKNRTSVETSLIISVVGFGSLFARVTHGILIDRKWLSPITGYTIGIVVGSISILLSPTIKTYIWFAMFGVVLGTCMGLNMSLLRVLVKEFLALKDMAQGVGLSAVVFFGTGDLIGPLLSGKSFWPWRIWHKGLDSVLLCPLARVILLDLFYQVRVAGPEGYGTGGWTQCCCVLWHGWSHWTSSIR